MPGGPSVVLVTGRVPLESSDANPSPEGEKAGVLHQLLGVTMSDHKIPPPSLCSCHSSPLQPHQGDLLLLLFISSTSMD